MEESIKSSNYHYSGMFVLLYLLSSLVFKSKQLDVHVYLHMYTLTTIRIAAVTVTVSISVLFRSVTLCLTLFDFRISGTLRSCCHTRVSAWCHTSTYLVLGPIFILQCSHVDYFR